MRTNNTTIKLIFVVAAMIVGFSTRQAHGLVTVVLSIGSTPSASGNGGVWSVYEQNIYTGGSSSSGLAGIQVHVQGSGGVTITSPGVVMLPQGHDYSIGSTGFTLFRGTSLVNGVATITAAQQIFYATNPAHDVTGAYLHVGDVAETINTGDDGSNDPNPGVITTATVADPVLIATGNYNYAGFDGSISFSGATTLTSLLPATMPTATTVNPPPITTFSPDVVVNDPAEVPEPASGVLLLVGCIGFLNRRRRLNRGK